MLSLFFLSSWRLWMRRSEGEEKEEGVEKSSKACLLCLPPPKAQKRFSFPPSSSPSSFFRQTALQWSYQIMCSFHKRFKNFQLCDAIHSYFLAATRVYCGRRFPGKPKEQKILSPFLSLSLSKILRHRAISGSCVRGHFKSPKSAAN